MKAGIWEIDNPLPVGIFIYRRGFADSDKINFCTTNLYPYRKSVVGVSIEYRLIEQGGLPTLIFGRSKIFHFKNDYYIMKRA